VIVHRCLLPLPAGDGPDRRVWADGGLEASPQPQVSGQLPFEPMRCDARAHTRRRMAARRADPQRPDRWSLRDECAPPGVTTGQTPAAPCAAGLLLSCISDKSEARVSRVTRATQATRSGPAYAGRSLACGRGRSIRAVPRRGLPSSRGLFQLRRSRRIRPRTASFGDALSGQR
jgi:hypothetical protein